MQEREHVRKFHDKHTLKVTGVRDNGGEGLELVECGGHDVEVDESGFGGWGEKK